MKDAPDLRLKRLTRVSPESVDRMWGLVRAFRQAGFPQPRHRELLDAAIRAADPGDAWEQALRDRVARQAAKEEGDG